MGLILGPELPEVKNQVSLIHCCVVPCSEELKMPTVDTNHEQVNRTRLYQLEKKALKKEKKTTGQETEKVCDIW